MTCHTVAAEAGGMKPTTYEITGRGRLGATLVMAFDGLTAQAGHCESGGLSGNTARLGSARPCCAYAGRREG